VLQAETLTPCGAASIRAWSPRGPGALGSHVPHYVWVRMKVAHLTTVDLSLRFLVYPQLLGTNQAGCEVYGISAPGPWVPELERGGVKHIPLASSTRGMDVAADLRAARQLWRVLREEQFDILHTHNPKPGLYGRILGRLAGVPVVVNTVHGLYAAPDDPLPKRLFVYALEAIASRFSDAELIQSPEDFVLLRRWHITPRRRTLLLGNGVDLARFDPARFDDEHRRRLRAEWGVGDGQVVVGIVGRLVGEKGYPELFEAMRSLDPAPVLVVVGPDDPDKDDALPRELVDVARSDGVRFLGMRSDVDGLYAAMDMFVLPSHREGYPRAAMEAAAMGLPIVATDIRGCREVVVDGVNGRLVPVRSPALLAEAISELASDSIRRRAMGDASRQRALERFDETRVVSIVIDTYRDLSRSKGLAWPSKHADSRAVIRDATEDDAAFCARLHATAIPTGFLPRLGQRFLTLLYRSMISSDEGVVVVADLDGHPVGFVAGTTDTADLYRGFVRRHGLAAGFAALPRLLRPSMLRRAWETFRYDDPVGGTPAELLSMAMVPEVRRRGIGESLGTELLGRLRQRGVSRVRVVVGEGNAGAIAAYEKMGFVVAGSVEVHRGERSVVLVWTS
jgi:glycosyltransferase involved in cell wall biosynthesis/ribosomal protein S18 acetylase RimI-like enzyme